MIYILDGMHSGGKSTMAAKLQQETGYPIKKAYCRTVEEVKKFIETNDNIIVDRFFIIPFIKRHYSLDKFKEVVTYLSVRRDKVKCYMCKCNPDLAWEREQKKERSGTRPVTREECDILYDYSEKVYSMNPHLWEVINTEQSK